MRMTNEEAIKKIKAKHDCMEKWCKGRYVDCNDSLCDACDLNYEQGNMGEQKEALRMAIKALGLIGLLKGRPCEACIFSKGACSKWSCPFDKAIDTEVEHGKTENQN